MKQKKSKYQIGQIIIVDKMPKGVKTQGSYTETFTSKPLIIESVFFDDVSEYYYVCRELHNPKETGNVKEKYVKLYKEEETMYEIRELKTLKEIYQEGRDQRNALSHRGYVKNLRDQGIKIYVCRKLDAPDKAFVTFAVAPKTFRGYDSHMWEKWGDNYVNIRGRDNAIPSADVITYVKAWCNGKGLIEIPPKQQGPLYSLFNGKTKVMDVYEEDELTAFIVDIAGQLVSGKTVSQSLFKSLGYTVTKSK